MYFYASGGRYEAENIISENGIATFCHLESYIVQFVINDKEIVILIFFGILSPCIVSRCRQ